MSGMCQTVAGQGCPPHGCKPQLGRCGTQATVPELDAQAHYFRADAAAPKLEKGHANLTAHGRVRHRAQRRLTGLSPSAAGSLGSACPARWMGRTGLAG